MPVYKSKLYTAKKGTASLKTTIPEGVVEFTKAKPGDELLWEPVGEVHDPTDLAVLVRRAK